jgi:hypothetical protein
MIAPKAAQLNEMLNRRFDLSLDLEDTADVAHLSAVKEHYWEKRVAMLAEHGEAYTLTSPEYAKAVLISEAVRMYLREIAPKRPKKSKNPRG